MKTEERTDYLARQNAREADFLLDKAKALERKAETLNLTRDARNTMYREASQIRACAYRVGNR